MRCKIDALLNKINLPKLSKQDEASFTIIRDLSNCRRVKTNNELSSAKGTFNKYLVPKNRLECNGEGCVNTGTFILADDAATDAVKYYARFDMTEVASGAVSFYIYDPNKGAYTISFAISAESNMTNSDTYTKAVAPADYDDDGFAPVVIDLSATPASTAGNGWEANYVGAYVNISATDAFGISSITFYESIEDFHTMDVVKIGCLSSMGGTLDASIIEAACSKAKFNDQMGGITFPVTGRMATPNYYLLNPLHGKGKAAKGFFVATEEYTVSADHTVTLADMLQSECRFVAIQRVGACDPYDAMMHQLVLPDTSIALTPEYYQVIQNADGSTTLRFADSLAGAKVLVSYPREVEVEERVSNADNLNSVHTSMTFSERMSEHVIEQHVFNNVFVTSFPYSISENDTDFSFSINIQPDKDGDYFHIYRIID